jgi:hypothetical protein
MCLFRFGWGTAARYTHFASSNYILIFDSGYSISRPRFESRTSKIQVQFYRLSQIAADCPTSIDGNRGQKSAHEHRYRYTTCAQAMCIQTTGQSSGILYRADTSQTKQKMYIHIYTHTHTHTHTHTYTEGKNGKPTTRYSFPWIL